MISLRALGFVRAHRQAQLVRRKRKRCPGEVGRDEHFDTVGFEQALDDVGFDLRGRAKDDDQVAHENFCQRSCRPLAATGSGVDPERSSSPASKTTRPPTIVSTGRVSRISRVAMAKMSRESTTRSASLPGFSDDPCASSANSAYAEPRV